MDSDVAPRRGETETHARLKRLALVWAQANQYAACAAEVSVPRCRYRADVAAYRPAAGEIGTIAIFECKQARSDLRRDNCATASTLQRLATVQRRREVLERCLRVHYPTLRTGESLFPEYDAPDFTALGHHNYTRVMREMSALQNWLYGGTKFECLVRYRCANLFYLVVPNELFREDEHPVGWGLLSENEGRISLLRKPVWHECARPMRLRFLERIAAAGTRKFNRDCQITREAIVAARALQT